MSETRNNHYVPQWYQRGFLEPGRSTLSYLDLIPPQNNLPDGRIFIGKSKFSSPTSRAFCQKDLYSTFFGTSVNDEIERKLFGRIDSHGSDAVRAFIGENPTEWHHHFMTFFEYLDIQKIRTPKGLDWLRAQYPRLTQNDLMFEMQGVRMMHCSIWTEGVREIVSAQDSSVKFIVSDHPVTIYNLAIPPNAKENNYPNDPSIALKGSQTIFPLNREFCLILTNLEYAQNPKDNPLVKRTFAGNYRQSMVRTDALIRVRRLESRQVIEINRIIKSRAKRYIAAGNDEWLYPEKYSNCSWSDLSSTLLPPKGETWRFGGEIYARFESGDVYYQDAFGRTERDRKFLKKDVTSKPLLAKDLCGCGSGRVFGSCCQSKPASLRPSWEEVSIRERNMVLFTGISNIIGLTQERDWNTVRRELTDEKIRDVYLLYDALWPRGTNLLSLLQKPDGSTRAVYTGALHPSLIAHHALGLSLYFDELLVQDPFIHPSSVSKKYSPIEHPNMYRQEFISSIALFLSIVPLIELGLVTLFPDPCNFDTHLRDQMFDMASLRSHNRKIHPTEDARLSRIMREEAKRSMLLLPRSTLRQEIQKASPDESEVGIEDVLDALELLRQNDPLAVLQEGTFEGTSGTGLYIPLKLAPNFEISMYLAQATGAAIVTDSETRWRELLATVERTIQEPQPLSQLRSSIEQASFPILHYPPDIAEMAARGALAGYPGVMRKVFRYLSGLPTRDRKANVEASLNSEFLRAHTAARIAVKKSKAQHSEARLSCLWPIGGIQDNTVNRLLLMSSSEHHLPSVPMALFIRDEAMKQAYR